MFLIDLLQQSYFSKLRWPHIYMNGNKPTARCSTATDPWAQIVLQVLFARFPGRIIVCERADTFTIPLSDTSTNEILEGQFKPLKSIIHFENG